MKKRKLLLVLLSTILIFTGCKAKTTETKTTRANQSQNTDLLYSEFKDTDGNFDFKGKTLRIMWDPLKDSPSALAKIKKFEEENNAKVEIVAGGWGDSPARIASNVASGDPADVTFIYATWYPDYMIAGFLEPIDQYIPLMQSLARDDDENYFSYEETKYFQWNGDRYCFTSNKAPTHSLLFYNKASFDEMGLEYPEELEKRGEWTHEKFVEYARILTIDKDGDGITDQFGMEDRDSLEMLLTSNNTDLVTLGRDIGEKTRLSLRDPASMHSLTTYETMKSVDMSIGGELALGTAAMCFRSISINQELTDAFTLDGWGFTGAPIGPNNKTGVNAGLHSSGWGILKGSKNPVMATVFLHYYLNRAVDYIDEENPPAPFGGFQSQEEYDRYIGYMQNLKKQDSHAIEIDWEIGTKPLSTLIEEYEPVFQTSLDKLIASTGVVMAGEGNPFKTATYGFETDISPLILNPANNTNARITHTPSKGGALTITTDMLKARNVYATTTPEKLLFEPGHKYKVTLDYTLNTALGEDGKYYLSFVVDGKKLSDTYYGVDATVGEKNTYEVEFDFYDDLQGGYLEFGGFNTSDILIENLGIQTVN